uniref:Putative aquaporin TIP-type alpha n=1 Tax=Phaseolus vulgaris TaxID=3885 RepID=V5N8C2_PHAVU|nr:putative aquaporin TIP-type alpha [Phaseolus vulgaris]
MATRRYSFGRTDEATHPDSMRASLAEFASTFIFVFAGEGSGLALVKIYQDSAFSAGELLALALAHAFALFAAVSASMHVSGGHVNPAVTFGALIGGRISVIRAVYYWIAQLLGSIVAALVLRLVTNNMRPSGFHVSPGVGVGHMFILEVVMTFGLMYTVYGTAIDPKGGAVSNIAPSEIGIRSGQCFLSVGMLERVCANRALSFGPFVLIVVWPHQWGLWEFPVGGLSLPLGVNECVVTVTAPPHQHQPLGKEKF